MHIKNPKKTKKRKELHYNTETKQKILRKTHKHAKKEKEKNNIWSVASGQN